MKRVPVLVLKALLAITAASAGGEEALASFPPQRDPDFLFGRPRGSLGMRGAWFNASASSDVYDFFEENLTIEKGDFDAPLLGVDAAFAVHPRIDLVVGFELSREGMRSEYRDFVDENDLPILQETKLTILPVTGSVKLYPLSRGRQVSRYAYVPARLRPYLGVGGGFVWYELEQTGDFVDFVDLTIFTSTFRSSGFGLAAQAFGGVEVTLGPRWFIGIEARKLWADDELSQDFVSFEPIDLGGTRLGAGVYFVF